MQQLVTDAPDGLHVILGDFEILAVADELLERVYLAD